MINVFGPRPSSVWGPAEQQLGHGFAGLPLDNVGVQYGLEALKKGHDHAGAVRRPQRRRSAAPTSTSTRPPSALAADRAGAGATPTAAAAINERQQPRRASRSSTCAAPTRARSTTPTASWAIRARLEREHGTFANQVIWFGAVPLIGDADYTTEGLLAMDRWLAAVEADNAHGSLAQKIIRRPPERRARPLLAGRRRRAGVVPGVGTVCELTEVQTRFGTPRMVAGEGIATDTNKCQLKPLRRTRLLPDHVHRRPVGAAADGVPDRRLRLEPTGCRPGRTIPWQTYQDPAGSVVYGGRPLGASPGGSGDGWTSAAFAGMARRMICALALVASASLIAAAPAAQAYDPVSEAQNFSKIEERQTIYNTPAYQALLRQVGLQNRAAATAMQAADPERNFTGAPVRDRRGRLRRRRPPLRLGGQRLRHRRAGAVHRAQRRDPLRPRLGHARGPAKRPGHRDHQRLGPGAPSSSTGSSRRRSPRPATSC